MTDHRLIRPLRALAAASLVVMAAGSLPLGAQSLHDHRGAEAFPDSIAAVSDGEMLQSIERDLMARAKRDRTNGNLHFRLGILALRLLELGDAAAEFKWATQLDPQWSAAWFQLGRAELALGENADTTRIGRHALLARDAWSRAAAAFTRSVITDTLAALQIEVLVARRGVTQSSQVARDGLRQAVGGGTRARSAVPALALGRIERLLGDTAAALNAFDLAANLPGGRGVGLVEAARTRVTHGDLRGVADYFAAAGIDDSAAVGLLRADLSWIATGAELAQFDRTRGDGRVAALAALWAIRDRGELRNDGERLREHYRRLAAAGRTYSNRDDLRFAVAVRHGEPDNRVASHPIGVAANESWRYRRADGDLLVHFLAGADSTNYRVVESIFDVNPNGQAQGAAGDDDPGLPPDLVDIVLRSRAQLSPFYQAAAAGRRDQLATFKVREREIGRASRNLALTTDRFPLRFDRDLAARFQVVAGRNEAQADVAVAFAVPIFSFDSTRPLAARFETRVRVVAWDSSSAAAHAVDTVLRLVPGLGADAVYGIVPLPLPPGVYSVRVALEAGGGRGAIGSRDAVRIGEPAELVLSDLALGVAGRGIELSAGRPLEPTGVFRRTDTLVASVMVLGREQVGARRVRAMVRAVPAPGKEEKWRGFPGRDGWQTLVPGSGPSAAMALPLKGLKSGRYELELVFSRDRGADLRSRTAFEVYDGRR